MDPVTVAALALIAVGIFGMATNYYRFYGPARLVDRLRQDRAAWVGWIPPITMAGNFLGFAVGVIILLVPSVHDAVRQLFGR